MYAVTPMILAVAGLLVAAPAPPQLAADPPDTVAPEPPQGDEGQHFCCTDLNQDPGGEGCIMIGKEHTGTCKNLLYCAGSWTKDKDGKVTCYS